MDNGRSKSALITGATGRDGAYLAELLLGNGYVVHGINLIRIVQETHPDEIYNLAAQFHVQVSFETPEYTANADAIGTLRLLEAIGILGRGKLTRFYQGVDLEALQQGAGDAAEGNDAGSPYAAAELYVLDHRKLSRSLQHARLERHSVQSRENLCSRQNCQSVHASSSLSPSR
jgi:GDPmannose 4,6-dehydratase